MTTKTKKKSDTVVTAGMVGQFVVRAVFEPGYKFLTPLEQDFVASLSDAAEFDRVADAIEAAKRSQRGA